jgi:hypothetical protein
MEKYRGRRPLGRPGVDGRIIKMDRKGNRRLFHLFHLAQDKNKWWAVVNTAMNLDMQ